MEINKVYSGFRLDRIERIDEINGTAYEMRHEKSGARLIYIDSPDSNKVFNIAFRTTPHNSTGVAREPLVRGLSFLIKKASKSVLVKRNSLRFFRRLVGWSTMPMKFGTRFSR